jgi:hypothetical protein
VHTVNEAVEALKRIGSIDRRACRSRAQRVFSREKMVEGYERVYARIFELEASRGHAAKPAPAAARLPDSRIELPPEGAEPEDA